MCGIAAIVGPYADETTLRGMLATLAPRGLKTEVHGQPGIWAGTQRLPIVDPEHATQPWRFGDWWLLFNGEIFNHRELRTELSSNGADWQQGHLTGQNVASKVPLLAGAQWRTESDTEVVLAAFLAWGEDAVNRLRGEFAFAIIHSGTGRVYLARDPLGVKPLYWSRWRGGLYLASEVKGLVSIGAAVREVPPGHHGWVQPSSEPQLRPYVDLRSLARRGVPIEDPDEAVKLVRTAIEESIRVRVQTDLTVGVVLSGGVDSSIVLSMVRRLHPDCVAFTIGAPSSEDIAYARRLTRELDVPHEVIELRRREIGRAQIREAIRLGELTEYGDIINAVASVPLFRRVAERGVRVVLTGDGSDELFGGYPMYERSADPQRLFLHMIENLYRTELQRVDRASLAHGVEARVPFLDPSVVELALRLPLSMKVRDGVDKWVVREAFADVLPEYIRRRPKNPLSHSTGLHDRARLFKPWFARIHRSFGYDRMEPVRRDWDAVLAGANYHLDRALAAVVQRQDYRPTEHARDLLGALRWNLPRVCRTRGVDRTRG